MSQQVSARAIGLFSIGAVVLLVIGVLIFGSGDWFKAQDRLEMVFTGSIKGLGVGSTVAYRGVRIGEVESIDISLYKDDINIRVVGLIVQGQSDTSLFGGETDSRKVFKRLVAEGMRAQLIQESLVTGRLQIQLEFYEEREGYAPASQSGYPVVPTVPSEIEMLGETVKAFVHKFKDLPINDIANNLASLTGGLNTIVNSDEVKVSMANLSQSLVHLNSLLADLDREKEVITGEVIGATRAVKGMADSFTEAANRTKPLIAGAENSLKMLDKMLVQSSSTLATYERLIQPGSELSVTLIETLQSFDRTSDQVRQLAETLQRNPESILMGKQR